MASVKEPTNNLQNRVRSKIDKTNKKRRTKKPTAAKWEV